MPSWYPMTSLTTDAKRRSASVPLLLGASGIALSGIMRLDRGGRGMVNAIRPARMNEGRSMHTPHFGLPRHA